MTESINLTPSDEWNRSLIENVHPPGWVNPQPAKRYNLVVVGAGTAGLVCAAGAAGLGAKVALVERHLMGGDCLNFGCVPSKGLIASARAIAGVRDAGRFGVRLVGETGFDFAAAMRRMRELRAGISRHDSAQRFRDLGVDVFLGQAEFEDANTVKVGEHRLRFRKAVIATGASPRRLQIPGSETVPYLTNETIFSLTELPPRLAVVGGGPIGCEMAQAFARFGSQVTLFETSERILIRDDSDASSVVQSALIRDGVEIITAARVTELSQANREVVVRYSHEGNDQQKSFDQILVSIGRAPNVRGLGLERIGVRFDEQKGVIVDDRLRTSLRHIFAAGDICSGYQFTHAADYMARIVLRNALFPFGRAKVSQLIIPHCTYTSPELAHVGLTPQESQQKGLKIATFQQNFESIDRALLDGETDGFVKIHVREGTDEIVGATIVGERAGDLISQITQAMQSGFGLRRIASVIYPYPTQADAIRKLGDQFNRSRLTPFVANLFRKWLKFRG